jgi:hypothetical protein
MLLPHHTSIILALVSGIAIGVFTVCNKDDRRVERRLLRTNKVAYNFFKIAYLVLTLSFAYNVRFVVKSLLEPFIGTKSS